MEEGKAKGGGWDGEDQHVHTAAVERTVTSSMGGVRAGVMSPRSITVHPDAKQLPSSSPEPVDL